MMALVDDKYKNVRDTIAHRHEDVETSSSDDETPVRNKQNGAGTNAGVVTY